MQKKIVLLGSTDAEGSAVPQINDTQFTMVWIV